MQELRVGCDGSWWGKKIYKYFIRTLFYSHSNFLRRITGDELHHKLKIHPKYYFTRFSEIFQRPLRLVGYLICLWTSYFFWSLDIYSQINREPWMRVGSYPAIGFFDHVLIKIILSFARKIRVFLCLINQI